MKKLFFKIMGRRALTRIINGLNKVVKSLIEYQQYAEAQIKKIEAKQEKLYSKKCDLVSDIENAANAQKSALDCASALSK